MIPQRVFDQLAARRKSWPIAYTAEDLLATWRGSDRLLLYVQMAEPDDTWTVGLTIDGESVEVKKAYSDVYPLGRERTFTGFYADVSHLQPGKRYEVEVTLPEQPSARPVPRSVLRERGDRIDGRCVGRRMNTRCLALCGESHRGLTLTATPSACAASIDGLAAPF